MSRLAVALFGVVLSAVAALGAESRRWTDATGKFSTDAEFVALADGVVQLRRTDDKLIKVPLGKLSREDQDYVRSLVSKPAAPAEKQPGQPGQPVMPATGVKDPVPKPAAGGSGGSLLDLLPGVGAARESARRSQSTNNLKQIGLALHNYHDVNQSFPPAFTTDAQGKPKLSWRVLILPYLEQLPLYDKFHLDEPWDSPNNKALLAAMPSVYRSPFSRAAPEATTYLSIRQERSIFPGKDAIRMAAILDGTSNTLMAVEAADAQAVPWTKPDDFTPDAEKPGKGLAGLQRGGFLALFGDGSVRFLRDDLDAKTLRQLFDRADGQAIDNSTLDAGARR